MASLTDHLQALPEQEQAYLLRHAAGHFHRAGYLDDLRRLLTDPDFWQAKILALKTAALLADYALAPADDSALSSLRRFFTQNEHIFDSCETPGSLTATLSSRLLPTPELKSLSERLKERLAPPYLMPLRRLPDLPAGALLRTIRFFAERCALNQSATLAVTSGEYGLLAVWEVATGRQRFSLKAHEHEPITDCAISGDGRLVVSASRDQTLKIWEVETGQSRATLRGHTDRVTCCALSGDGRLIASGSRDQTVRVWEVATGRQRLMLTGHEGEVTCCALDAAGRTLVSGSDTGELKVWEVATGRQRFELEGHINWGLKRAVGECALSADGARLLSRANEVSEEAVKVWDLISGREIVTLTGTNWFVTSCALSPNGQLAVAGQGNGLLLGWDAQTGDLLFSLTGHTNGVSSCAVADDNNLILTTGADGTIRLWDRSLPRQPVTAEQETHYIKRCAASADGRVIVGAAVDDYSFKLWDGRQGTLLKSLPQNSRLADCDVSRDGGRLVLAREDETPAVVDLGSGFPGRLMSLKGHTREVNCCALSGDGRLVATGSRDATLRIWNARTGVEQFVLVDEQAFPASVERCAVNGDGSLVVVISNWGRIRLVNGQTGKLYPAALLDFADEIDKMTDCAISDSGDIILSVSRGQVLHVWQRMPDSAWPRWQGLHTMTGHEQRINGCALSRSGHLAISASQDQSLRVWETLTGRCLATIGVDSPLHDCACWAEGRYIVAAGQSGLYYFELVRDEAGAAVTEW